MKARTAAALLSLALVSLAIVVRPAAQVGPPPQNQPPTFRAGVEYVEVDARVVDRRNDPVLDLAQRDFQVFEDGVRQDIVTFAAVSIPLPGPELAAPRSAAQTQQVESIRPDVASNARQRQDGRVFLIALDDLFIDPARTNDVRRFLSGFVDRSIGPDDLVAVVSLAEGGTFENFTNDKSLLKNAIAHLSVGKAPSETIAKLAFDLKRRAGLVSGQGDGGADSAPIPLAMTTDARTTQQSLVRLVRALSGMTARGKAIIFVSEGTPFETVTNTEGLSLINDLQRTSDLARRSDVPIYPVDPRALTALHEEAILVPIVSVDDDPAASLQKELSNSQRALRGLAEDTGGFAVVGVNDLSGGLDRIAKQVSAYYVLGFYSKNPKHDGKYRKIEVKVDRRDVMVRARHGYMAQPAKEPKPASFPGPPGSPENVRAALSAVLPLAGMSLTTTAAAFREGRDRTASVAVVLEGAGADLTLASRDGASSGPLDLLTAALQPHGEIAATDSTHLQLTLPAQTADRVQQYGFRWLARLNNVKPGRYQLRTVAASGPDVLGSVWYNLIVPDFTDGPLTMSDVLVASVSGLQVPTFKPDKAMQELLRGPATANRRFTQADGVVVFAEIYDNRASQLHNIDTAVVVKNDRGAEVFRSADTQSSRQLAESQGVLRVRTPFELKDLSPGSYTVTVDAQARQDASAHASRTIPIQVVANAGR
jgi:VWFA-related protein